MARSYTTTAYLLLFRDTPSSSRTLWSAVIKLPNFFARSRASQVCFLQGALVIFLLKQTSKSRSFGTWVKILPHPWFRCHYLRIFQIWFRGTEYGWIQVLILSDFLWNPLPSSGRSSNRSFESFLSLIFWISFWISGDGTSVLVASSSLRFYTELEDELEAGGTSCLSFLIPSLLSTSPVTAMLQTNCFQDCRTTLERQEARHYLICK